MGEEGHQQQNPEKTGDNQPKQGDLVIAVVAKITKFGSYCRLPEYNNMEVFLPLREISSGWIKNIHGFLHEGQNCVGKIILIDQKKNTVDISLKRVMPKEAKEKIGQYNLEKRLDALFHQKIKTSKLEGKEQELVHTTLSKFGNYVNFAINAVKYTGEYEDLPIPKQLKTSFREAIENTKKSRKFFVSYTMSLSTQDSITGATKLKEIMAGIEKTGVDVKYISAPKYSLKAEGKNYADAESKIQAAVSLVKANINKGFSFNIEKDKSKKEKEGIMEQYLS